MTTAVKCSVSQSIWAPCEVEQSKSYYELKMKFYNHFQQYGIPEEAVIMKVGHIGVGMQRRLAARRIGDNKRNLAGAQLPVPANTSLALGTSS